MSSRPGGRASAWCAAKAERAGELAAERFRPQAGDPSAGRIEPLTERFGACAGAAAATAPPGEPQSSCPWRVRTIGATTVTGNARPAQLEPSRPGSTKRRREPTSEVAAL